MRQRKQIIQTMNGGRFAFRHNLITDVIEDHLSTYLFDIIKNKDSEIVQDALNFFLDTNEYDLEGLDESTK